MPLENSLMQKGITSTRLAVVSAATRQAIWHGTVPSPTARILRSMPLTPLKQNIPKSQEKTNLQGTPGPPEDPKYKPCNTRPSFGFPAQNQGERTCQGHTPDQQP